MTTDKTLVERLREAHHTDDGLEALLEEVAQALEGATITFDEGAQETVAHAIRKGRFDRTRRGNVYDPEALSENDLDDARNALSAMSTFASAAVAAERERCARIADEADRQDEIDNGHAMTGAAGIAANNIRALPPTGAQAMSAVSGPLVVTEELRSLRAALAIYDRVHGELDEGKKYSEIDNGLVNGGEKSSYDRWLAYMTQTIINRARSLCLTAALPHMQGAAGREKIEDSCGCVFCDLDIEPSVSKEGTYFHITKHGIAPCNRAPVIPLKSVSPDKGK